MRKVFLECVVVKQVYKFDEKSTASVSKGESNTMCHSIFLNLPKGDFFLFQVPTAIPSRKKTVPQSEELIGTGSSKFLIILGKMADI